MCTRQYYHASFIVFFKQFNSGVCIGGYLVETKILNGHILTWGVGVKFKILRNDNLPPCLALTGNDMLSMIVLAKMTHTSQRLVKACSKRRNYRVVRVPLIQNIMHLTTFFCKRHNYLYEA